MQRTAFVTLFCALGALATPMTLQFANRWNGATIVASRYTVVDSSPTRILMGGYADNDAYFTLTDNLGNILASRRWDSVGGGEEAVVDVELDADGTVVILVASDTNAWLLGYNGDALTPVFEVNLGASQTGNCALFKHDGGATYVAQTQGANLLLRQFDGSGTANWTRTLGLTVPFLGDLEGAPSGGVVIAGTSGTRAHARHYTSAGAMQWSYTSNADNTNQNIIRKIVVEDDGSAVGIGMHDPVGASTLGAAFFRIGTNGVGSAIDIPGYAGSGRSLVKRATNVYYGLAYDGIQDSVFSYNRTSDVTSLLSQMNGAASEIAIDPTPTRYYVNNYTTSNPVSSGSRVLVGDNVVSNFYSPQFQIQDFARGGGTSMIGVGSRNRDCAYVFFEGSQSPQIFDQPVLAYTARKVVDVAHDPNGAAYIASTYTDSGGGDQSTLTKVAANGNVLWYRNFSLPSGRFQAIRVLRGADGDVVIAGSDSVQSRIHIRKLDGATGTQLWARDHFTIGGDVQFADVSLSPSSEIYVASYENLPASLTQVRVRKLSSTNGLLTHTAAYAYLESEVRDIQVQATQAGVIATSIHGLGASAKAVHRIYNSNLGFMNGLEYAGVAQGIHTAKAANGDIAMAYLNDSGTLGAIRFDAATFTAEVDNAVTNRALPIFADCGPNDNMVILSGHTGGGYRITSIGDGGAMLWETTIEPSVNSLIGLVVDGSNNAFILGEEPQGGGIQSAYTARYLSTGARSAQRRLAGNAAKITQPSAGQVWLFGDAPTRNQARQITFTRYNY